jgi:hypothetical protein
MSMWYQWFIAGADDHHRAALGLLGVAGELARHGDDLVARHAGDLLRPGRRVGHVLVVGLGDVLAAEAAIDAVVGEEQVEDRRDQRLAVGKSTRFTGTLRSARSGWSVPLKWSCSRLPK